MRNTLTGDVPRRIAGYKILNQIGEGGMARVFKGVNDVGGVAAVKLINPYYQHDPSFRDRFRREAEALTQVEHEGIVRILQWVDDGEILAMIMEFLNGQPFNRHLDAVFSREENSQTVKPLNPDGFRILENLRIMRDIALAMSHVHRKGVCHRDLKPDNIIIIKTDKGSLAKIIDFGICHPQGSPRRTRIGIAIGTPGYMAPEQIIPSREIDNRTDIYALGLILFEAYSGSSIFAGHDINLELYYQLMRNADFVSRRIEEESIPSHVAPIIKRCLKFGVEERYPFMDQLVGALDLAFEQEDHFLIGRINLLTAKKDQREIITLGDDVFDIADGEEGQEDFEAPETTDIVALPPPKSSKKKFSKKYYLAAILIIAFVSAALSGLAYLASRSDKNQSHPVAQKQSPVKKSTVSAMMDEKKEDSDLLAGAQQECKRISPDALSDSLEMIMCLRRKSWVLFRMGDLERSYSLAKKIEEEYWQKRDWRYKKIVRTDLRSIFGLLGRIYRHRAGLMPKYGSEWDILSRQAAYYEQMVKNLSVSD